MFPTPARSSAAPRTAGLAALALLLLVPASPAADPAPSPDRVARAFERFTGLAGDWRGRSTVGWTGTTTFRLLGRGTVVLAVSSFDDAPPERDMASAIHRDGDRLLLTHYCEAGNQPRLVATRITPDATEVELAFLDGTGMSSRDDPHMDRAVFRFPGPDRFTSRWTFYRYGEEQWGEEIEYVRVQPGAANPDAGSPEEGR